MHINKIYDALKRLNHTTGATFNYDDFLNLTDEEYLNSDVSDVISLSAIKTEILLMDTEYDALEYSRLRKAKYDLLNQDEMRYDDLVNTTTTWQDAIAAIKAEIPKPTGDI